MGLIKGATWQEADKEKICVQTGRTCGFPCIDECLDSPVMGEGIFEQIRKQPVHLYDGVPPTQKEIVKLFKEMAKKEAKIRKQKLKIQKDNTKHLIKRSEELGKEIPIVLLLLTDPFLNSNMFHGQWFRDRYKEWL